ncbi:MAG: RNA polymerase-binding protein DksA [Halomonadaceae bacterium]|nr:MAG: RNA polymerase-binding protein DksA [Halomonadaceae bacterium]
MTHVEQAPITHSAELLSAPEDDYMSPRQLAFFRRLLSQQRDELMQSADTTLDHLREVPRLAEDGDRAQLEEEYALELRIRDRERKLLRKIDEALDRIDHGDYGWCLETGEPIGLQRLLIRPTATLSIEGQEIKETRETRYRH